MNQTYVPRVANLKKYSSKVPSCQLDKHQLQQQQRPTTSANLRNSLAVPATQNPRPSPNRADPLSRSSYLSANATKNLRASGADPRKMFAAPSKKPLRASNLKQVATIDDAQLSTSRSRMSQSRMNTTMTTIAADESFRIQKANRPQKHVVSSTANKANQVPK